VLQLCKNPKAAPIQRLCQPELVVGTTTGSV
jgi:hypothetical protein